MLNDIYQGLDPIAFSLGPLVVRWYGLAYVLGFVCAAAIIYFVAKRWKLGMSEDNLLTLMVCAIVGVVLGARIGYVLFYGDGYYLSHPLEILAFNQGGMSFHGGLVGLLIGGAVAARMTRIPFLTLADLGSIAAPLGLFFGRCANFVNGELWGAPSGLPRKTVSRQRRPQKLEGRQKNDAHNRLFSPLKIFPTRFPIHIPFLQQRAY